MASQHELISSEIAAIRKELEEMSAQEYELKKDIKRYGGIVSLIEEETDELNDQKRVRSPGS